MRDFLRVACLALLLLGVTLALPHAQERTAGGNLQTETSWTALKSLVDAANKRVSIMQIDMDAAKNCAAQTKIWDPVRGCVNIDTTYYDKMVACADLGQLYDKGTNKCVSIDASKKGCTWKDSMCPYKSGCHIRTRNANNQVVFQDVPTKWNDGDVYVYRLGETDNYYASQCRDGSLTGYYTAQ